MSKKVDFQKREFLKKALFGSSLLGLASFATGIPLWVLKNPKKAMAQQLPAVSALPPVIYSYLSSGDPINNNVPGTYDAITIPPNTKFNTTSTQSSVSLYHSAYTFQPKVVVTKNLEAQTPMQKMSLNINGQNVYGAAAWGELNHLNNTCFFHLMTSTVSHGDISPVQNLQGVLSPGNGERGTWLSGFLTEQIYNSYQGTTGQSSIYSQVDPVPLFEGTYSSGRTIPATSPTSLQKVLASSSASLAINNVKTIQEILNSEDLVAIRKQTLDSLYKIAKENGNSDHLNFIDSFALSANQTIASASSASGYLSSIGTDHRSDQCYAAIALLKLKVCPLVTIGLDSGGDNHVDELLKNEAENTLYCIQAIDTLMTTLAADTDPNIQQTTFVMLNVFGRTLDIAHTPPGTPPGGRGHNNAHNVGLIIGPRVSGGVVGGIVANASGALQCSDISSQNGSSQALGSGDILAQDSLASFGKTVAAVVGLPEEQINQVIINGSIVKSVVKSS